MSDISPMETRHKGQKVHSSSVDKTTLELLSTSRQCHGMKRMIQSALLSAEMHPDRVGERVTAMRMCLEMSKAQFADSLGLDRSSLSKIEAGTKGLDIVVGSRIADLFGFGLDYTYRGVLTDVPEGHRHRIMAEIYAAKIARVLPV